MHDVPAQLTQMGVEVANGLIEAEEAGDLEVLAKFAILPKLFSGRQITVEFPMGSVRAAYAEDCQALRLEAGATVVCQVTIDSGQTFYVHGEREIALAPMSVPKNSTVRPGLIQPSGLTHKLCGLMMGLYRNRAPRQD